ncbi:MAG: hypothetical protein R3Y57_07815 [Erysipelotrichaceae bacterium]
MLENFNDFLSLISIILLLLCIMYYLVFHTRKGNKESLFEKSDEYYREFDDIEDEDIDY